MATRRPYSGGSEYTFQTKPGSGGIPVFGHPMPNHAMVAPRPDTGYDVKATRLNARRRDTAIKKANAQLHDGEWYVNFFVDEISIDISLSGSTGQGQFTRDFYAHNMTMPSFLVKGQCLNQEDYGTLCEFIHQAQNKGVYNSTLTQLLVSGGGFKIVYPRMKGTHKGIIAQGYVDAMPRKHERFEYAPEFTMPFVVVDLLHGPYKDYTASNNTQEAWSKIISDMVGTAINPIPEEQKKAAEIEASNTVERAINPIGESLRGLF